MPKAVPEAAGKPRKRKGSHLSREVFQDLWHIYSDRKGGIPVPALPGDVDDLLQKNRIKFTGRAKQAEALYTLMKYGPAREAFANAWRNKKPRNGSKADGHEPNVSLMADVLSDTAHRIAKVIPTPVWSTWTLNCGRVVSKRHGPHQVLKDMGIVSSSSGCQKRAGDLQLTKSMSVYRLCKVSRKCETKIATFVAMTTALATAAKAPTTVTEWNTEFVKITDACNAVPGLQDPSTRCYESTPLSHYVLPLVSRLPMLDAWCASPILGHFVDDTRWLQRFPTTLHAARTPSPDYRVVGFE